MTPKSKAAIGRLRAIRAVGAQLTGTAFVVTDRHLLTAFHVVGDRAESGAKGIPILYPTLWFEPAGVESARFNVRVVADACDAIDDWALLEAEEPISEVTPLPLGAVSQREMQDRQTQRRKLEFESWGFPTLARMSGSGIIIAGHVQDRDARYQNAWAYQLFSENAAAALGDPLNGLSGAPCLIDGAAVGIIRSNLIVVSNKPTEEPAHIAGGILYACPVGTATLQERCAAYLPSLDPIRGLPGLPRQDLPLQPFRYLRWYGAEHAEVFFGRNSKLRTLYFQIIDPNGPPVVIVYGASGVGKSSLLEAGLLPRLSSNYEVRRQRREAAKPLVQSLDDVFTSAQVSSQTSGKPIVILLDQIEEAFTDPRLDGNAELTALGQRIKAIISSRERVPRIILGFRSDWLASIRARLSEAEIPVGEFYLERLTREEIQEVVWGVASTDRLRKFYGVEVDEDLPQRVADDLLSDPKSPVSPVLSIILTRLWIEAKTHHAGEQVLSAQVYDQRMRDKLDLDQFLADQVKAVALDRPEDVASGLVNDVLYRHTTDHGTAKESSSKELAQTYYHLHESYLRGLISTLSTHSLLYSTGDKLNDKQIEHRVTRLAHDTLAPPVRKVYEKSDLPGQRAERRLASWVEDWDPSRPESGILDAASLALVENGAPGMRAPTDKESKFIRASNASYQSALKRSRNIRALVAVLVATAIAGPTIWWNWLWVKEHAYWLTRVHALAAAEERGLKPKDEFIECADCPKMVIVPADSVQIGSLDEPNEQPPHVVMFEKPFAVAMYELTFAQWDACVAYGDCAPDVADEWGRGRQPVINVSWKNAKQYVAWLKRVTGKDYRLLTEAEWEYAARSGRSSYFSFGDDDVTHLKNYAWYEANSDNQAHPVGGKLPNPFGLYDMHGNVWEWVEDCYRDSYRDAAALENCNARVIRGGSWLYRARKLRSASRDSFDESKGKNDIGVRVGRSLAP
jgi:formylglycine-generating enzyme required for sulfatase activity